ncbi:RHS repeat-associated core domain-containing protein [Sedimentisphaera salicampi]|uniref:hypothetical protein n=1 Tax=Sedimentisphaera salicampi TaxID=1941349 RepID=UPI000B9AFB12|nr:hypothetical protein [Sedimentisphaera salicampi]OXU15454.1 RHS repeat-associated core domain protein [Sedimentisphaera salicampi]
MINVVETYTRIVGITGENNTADSYVRQCITRFAGPLGYIDTINPYTYCANNPINWIDPWGLFSWGNFAEAVFDTLFTPERTRNFGEIMKKHNDNRDRINSSSDVDTLLNSLDPRTRMCAADEGYEAAANALNDVAKNIATGPWLEE